MTFMRNIQKESMTGLVSVHEAILVGVNTNFTTVPGDSTNFRNYAFI